eukprot:3402961-Pyramimonas_sp.AAC.1
MGPSGDELHTCKHYSGSVADVCAELHLAEISAIRWHADGPARSGGPAGATFEAEMSLIPLMDDECEARDNATHMLPLHIDDLSQHHW